MPLSDVEIWAEIGAGYLEIDPLPIPDRVVSSSIDLLLHTEILVLPNPEDVRGITVDPGAVQVTQLLESRGRKEDLSSKPYELIPGEFVIAKRHEEVEQPAHLAARVEGKSSLGRLGLSVHVTAPTIHAGYKDRLTLEMINAGPFALKLTRNLKICQLIVELLGIPSRTLYKGRFLGQT